MDITWQTSEPANSVVWYGLSPPPNLSVTNLTLTTDHSVRIPRLIAGQTYYFFVGSTDDAGNIATNNNQGAFYSFVGVTTPTVLFIDAYDPDPDSPVIPDSSYTNAIAAAGFTFTHWVVIDQGPPGPADYQGYPVVIWRTTDDIINYEGTNNTLTPQQREMIQSYLNAGGSFLMSSMGILSQLGDVRSGKMFSR